MVGDEERSTDQLVADTFMPRGKRSMIASGKLRVSQVGLATLVLVNGAARMPYSLCDCPGREARGRRSFLMESVRTGEGIVAVRFQAGEGMQANTRGLLAKGAGEAQRLRPARLR